MSVVVTNTQVVGQQQPPPVMVPAQQPQVVVVQQTQTQTRHGPCGIVRENYKATVSQVLGWIQIVGAIFCIIFNSIGIDVEIEHNETNYLGVLYGAYYDLYYCFQSAYGIWSAIFYILAGGFALGAACHKTSGMIITNMVFSIIAAVFGFSAFCTGIGCMITHLHASVSTAAKAMSVLLMIILLILFICTIWSSAICCAAVCCGARSSTVQSTAPAGQTIVYTNNPAGGAAYPPQQMAPPPPGYQQTQPGASAPGQYPAGQPNNGEMPPKY